MVSQPVAPAPTIWKVQDQDQDKDQDGNFFKKIHADCHLSTANCQPWSRLSNPPPLGFNDTRAQAFINSARIHSQLRYTNPELKGFVENVIPHEALIDDIDQMQDMWDMRFIPSNAGALGSGSSRPRNIATNMVDVASQPITMPAEWSKLLDEEYFLDRPIMPCIVASRVTRNPPYKLTKAREYGKHKQHALTPTENEVFQGYPPGISNGGITSTHLGLSDDKRRHMMGNALNNAHARLLMRNLSNDIITPDPVSKIMMHAIRDDEYEAATTDDDHDQQTASVTNHEAQRLQNSTVTMLAQETAKRETTLTSADVRPDIVGWTTEQLEEYLGKMTQEERRAWMQLRRGFNDDGTKWEMPKLHLRVKKECLPLTKLVHKDYGVPAGLRPGMAIAVQRQIDRGYFQDSSGTR